MKEAWSEEMVIEVVWVVVRVAPKIGRGVNDDAIMFFFFF